METSKVRLKIGEHEFEAEGTPESVQSQFDAFREIISLYSSTQSKKPVVPSPEATPNEQDKPIAPHVPLERILRVAGRVVSLTAIPAAIENSALLIMLGNKDLRNNESVTGQEIGDGLAQSGRPVARTDRVMEKLISEAFVLKSGFKRSTRYRLTNSGQQRALAIARELISSLP